MADYYSILKKTIGALPENNGAARRSVYSRARTAIVNQLKAYEPPLMPSEITAEQLRLEEAIRKVEAEAARETLGLSLPPKSPESDHEPIDEDRPSKTGGDPQDLTQKPGSELPNYSGAGPETSLLEVTPVEEMNQRPADAVKEAAASPLKEVVEEAGKLGDASQQAVLSAKEVMDADAGAKGSRRDPLLEPSESHQALHQGPVADDELFEPASNRIGGSSEHADEQPLPRGRKGDRSASAVLRDRGSWSAFLPVLVVGGLVLAVTIAAVVFFSGGEQVAEVEPREPDVQVEAPIEVEPVDVLPQVAEPARTSEESEAVDAAKNEDRLLDDSGQPAADSDVRSVTTTVITPNREASEPETALADTAAQPETDQAAAAVDSVLLDEEDVRDPTEAGVQRSILYEEGDDANGAGTASQGQVTWSVQEESALDGEKLSVLTAVITVPERNVSVNLQIKPNKDASLPASHLIEIKYDFPADFPSGDVERLPGLVMKLTEEARGDALIGASVKVSPGYFWIALSNISSETQRNIGLLRERGWIDIPMVYANGKRGILTLEKGGSGSAAVEQAISAWQAG